MSRIMRMRKPRRNRGFVFARYSMRRLVDRILFCDIIDLSTGGDNGTTERNASERQRA